MPYTWWLDLVFDLCQLAAGLDTWDIAADNFNFYKAWTINHDLIAFNFSTLHLKQIGAFTQGECQQAQLVNNAVIHRYGEMH